VLVLKKTARVAALLLTLGAAAQAQTIPSPVKETGASGSSRATRLTPADVKEALEAQGYSQVEVLQETATGFNAKATKDGKSHALSTDPKGTVMPRH
jgi:hypothetical protein